MITKLPFGIKKHSWWRSNDVDRRVFVIVDLPIDWTPDGQVFFPRVGLLELEHDDPLNLDIEIFLQQVNAGRLLPVARKGFNN